MKAEVKIPDGWRRLRKGENIRVGQDRWFFAHDMAWAACGISGKIGVDTFGGIFIRKSKPGKAVRS